MLPTNVGIIMNMAFGIMSIGLPLGVNGTQDTPTCFLTTFVITFWEIFWNIFEKFFQKFFLKI
jgi:hypothetical protein